MIRILVILIMGLPLSAMSQNYINKTRAQVKKELTKQGSSVVSAGSIIAETDSTLSFTVNHTGALPAEFTCSFDEKGKCKSEKIVTACDSCYSKYLQEILDIKKYHWKRINENQYVSDFESRLMIELPTEKNIYSFSIIRMDWSKILYQILMEKS